LGSEKVHRVAAWLTADHQAQNHFVNLRSADHRNQTHTGSISRHKKRNIETRIKQMVRLHGKKKPNNLMDKKMSYEEYFCVLAVLTTFDRASRLADFLSLQSLRERRPANQYLIATYKRMLLRA